MIRSKEEDSQTFLQFVEDCGIRAYNELVTQSIGHIWNEKNRINLQEKHDKKRKQEEDIKRWEEVITEGRHQRSSSVSMPAPAEKPSPHKHHFPCSPGFTVRSQSLHSVGEGVEEDEDEGSPTSRKQPPPKPRRDPTTKLSISSEAVDLSPTTGKGEDLEHCDGTQGSSEDCRKVPPPKPRRNPNTQLSTSFDESYARNHGSKGSPTIHFLRDRETPLQSQNQQDSDGDEPVYIEMSGNVMREPDNHNEEDEPGEAVYEEMKYPSLDEFESRFDALSCRSQCVTPCLSEIDLYAPVSRCTTPRGTLCDIPPPFPNLLTHRPPLLVFPPSPAQCSPKSKESSLTPLDMTKLQMVENGSHGKSSSLDSASTSHLRRAERELTATPTITVSGRSSAPPLPCALYKSSSSLHGYQRSHSACPSPVSMGRCLTPLSLMRSPPFDGPFPGAGLPRSASATPHGKGSPPHDMTYGGRHHSSMQNVSVARSRTPTSPLDELTNLFTTGRNMLKKNTSGRRNKELGEGETKGKSHESKRDHKERSHHKDSKRDKERSGSGKSSHRRDNKDKLQLSAEAFSRHEHKDAGYSKPEPLARRDSKDKGCNCADLPVRQESKDQGSSMDGAPQRDSKDRGCNTVEIIFRRDSRERGCNGLDHLPGQDGKELQKNGLSTRRDSTEKTGFVVDHLARHELKDQSRSALQSRQERKDSGTHGVESGQDKEKNNHGESRRGSKEAISNDRGTHTNEALPRYKWKEKKSFNKDSPKTLDKYARSGSSALSGASHSTRATTRPTEAQGSSNSDLKPVPKANRSTPVDSSPVGTPQRQHLDLQQIPPMPWLYGDSTMMEMIEKKQRLCREIRSCQRPQHNHCKVESLPSISSWKKSNGAKKYGPPPYSTHTTVFWDTAI